MSLGTEFLAFARTLGSDARLRLAPTPSGYLHRGNALNFILNWLAARLQPDTKLLLRIDDLDADRKRPEYLADIFESLQWLKLDWDEGPHSPDDFEAHWSQNLRKSIYYKALEELRATGLLYACAKSRQDLAPYSGQYPLEFRNQNLDLDTPNVAWRIITPPDFPLPDFVVRRRDGVPAYQVASVVDDLHFGVTHVIRGADLTASTVAQQWLAERMGRPDFSKIQFWHHPLLTDEQGIKLSKSAGAASLHNLRVSGLPPTTVFEQLATWLGMSTISDPTAGNVLAALRTVLK